MRSTTLTGLLLTALLLVSGCGAGEDPSADPESIDTVTAVETTSSQPTELDTTSSQPTELDEIVADTLEFSAQTLDGKEFDGAQLAGTPTVLWFWAPWCPTCHAQVSGVEAVAAEYDGKVNVVGVGGLSDAADIRDFAEGVAGPTHLIDEEGSVWKHFGIAAQSTYVLLDAEGTVIKDGYLDNEALEKAVAELVG